MATQGIPAKPTGTAPLFFFLRWVWDYLAGGKFPFADSDTVKWNFNNGYYSAKAAASQKNAGSLVYVRACLQDGTTCYVPIYVQGTVYRNPGTGTTEAAIDSGSVPTGSTVIV